MFRWQNIARYSRHLRFRLSTFLGLPAASRTMDIGHGAFPLEVLKILQEVSESHFLAFDLEFSGVASRRPAGTGKGKLSLQEYYEDIKAAAEKYQILQFGLTIVKEDLKKGRYVARPYNFNISPLTSLRERHFGREWSYHSGGKCLETPFNVKDPDSCTSYRFPYKERLPIRPSYRLRSTIPISQRRAYCPAEYH